MVMPVFIQKEKSGAWLLHLWIQPGASRSEWAGCHGDRLKIRLQSPPVDGRANQELLRFLSEALDVPTRDLELMAGRNSRGKTVCVRHLSEKSILERLPTI
jgi:uncharacterized protein